MRRLFVSGFIPKAAVVAMDTDMDKSLRDRLVQTCIPNIVERVYI